MPGLIQLKELIPVETPIGNGHAIVLDFGEHENYWTVVLQSGAIVTFRQDRIRTCKSYTHSRGISDEEMKNIVNSNK